MFKSANSNNNNGNGNGNTAPKAYANVYVVDKKGEERKVGAISVLENKAIHKSILANEAKADELNFKVKLVFVNDEAIELI
jgi:hypothetical protein